MKRSIEYIVKDMQGIESFLSRRDIKYRRNYNRYYNNGIRWEDIYNIYGANPLSVYQSQDEILGNIPKLNILRSAVDTTVSKLAQTKVRPFFNPVLGNYKTVKTCRNAQTYFDEIYESQKVYQKAIQAFKDALIFDMGVLWIDDETATVKKVSPWDFGFDVGEMTQGRLTRCSLRRRQFPLVYLEDKIKKNATFMNALETTPGAYVDYRIYWDLLNKLQYHFIGTELIEQRNISQPFLRVIQIGNTSDNFFIDQLSQRIQLFIHCFYLIQHLLNNSYNRFKRFSYHFLIFCHVFIHIYILLIIVAVLKATLLR